MLRLARRVGVHALRNKQTRGGGGDGWMSLNKFWSEGSQTGYNGFLFGEVPTPGKSRPWEWWEGMWYGAYGTFFVGVWFIYNAKPKEALDIKYWARPRAELELEEEQRMMDKLASRPDLKERLVAVAKDLNMIEAELYDLILMRKEYKVKMGLHSGRVPADLADIYKELSE